MVGRMSETRKELYRRILQEKSRADAHWYAAMAMVYEELHEAAAKINYPWWAPWKPVTFDQMLWEAPK